MAMAQLLSNTDFTLYADARLLAELASDANTDGTVSSSSIITESLLRAGEEVASAATRSNSYTIQELEDMGTAGNAMLRGLVADLALCFLFERRGGDVAESVKAKAMRAQETLRDLRDGKKVFAVDANRAAGTATVAVIQTAIRGSLSLVSDSTFYPNRRGQSY